ncbi:hypothetical protein CXG81DRAFT_15985 [Caulochytrium protostelioides]|uniref:t-SNARE n=1 Tax=Caulochytrium protostelioides TaxID=1555241 RepID=A0A4P9WY14_9FUNG|nr:t-SNARE [Caulochytrium protostelioides]RKO98379.1 hypothetical protein CXG81DRAFT_15985 [Caulochytrium protostelioides]|eukprot:RKO98379.1 hypothetical protein CXG81DRAFT_15985 [Caulochytrium protostelioides]
MRDRLGDLSPGDAKGSGDDPIDPHAPASSPPPYEEEDGRKPGDKKEEKKKAKKTKEDTGAGGSDESPEMAAFFTQIGQVRDAIAAVKRNTEQIESMHQQAMNVISEKQSAEITEELDGLMNRTNKEATAIRNQLKAMEADNKALAAKNTQPSELRVRVNQHGAITKKFLDVMNEYKAIQQKYQEKYKQRLQRQFLIVKPQATPEELAKVLDGESGPVFAQQVLSTGQRAEARRALQDIQDRHHDILRIEQSIIELQQLFMDMAVLVAAQGEMINQIEVHVNDAVETTEAGVQALKKAVKTQKASRKKMCCIMICLIGILLAAVLGGLGGGKVF